MKDVQAFNINNPLHKAIFLCVITGGAGDCRIVEYDDSNHGHVITAKQYGAGVYKWSVRNDRVYCCRQTPKIGEEGI